MAYAVKVNGYFYKGLNCQGLEIFGTSVEEAKHYHDKAEAHKACERLGGELASVPAWAVRF